MAKIKIDRTLKFLENCKFQETKDGTIRDLVNSIVDIVKTAFKVFKQENEEKE